MFDETTTKQGHSISIKQAKQRWTAKLEVRPAGRDGVALEAAASGLAELSVLVRARLQPLAPEIGAEAWNAAARDWNEMVTRAAS